MGIRKLNRDGMLLMFYGAAKRRREILGILMHQRGQYGIAKTLKRYGTFDHKTWRPS